MAHLTVRSQLTLAFGGLAAAVVLVSGMSLHALGAEGDRFNSVVHGVDKRRAVASELRTAVDQRAIAARNAVLVTRPADAKAEQAEVARAHDAVRVRLQELQSLMTDSTVPQAARDLVGEIAKVEARYAPVALGILELAQGGHNAEAIAKMNDECRPLLAELGRASDAFIAFNEQRAQAMVTEAEADFRLQRNLQIVLCLVATGAALVAGYFITKRLSHALGAEPAQLGDVAQRVAAGDLGPVAGAAAAPAGSVLASLGRMQASLADIVGQVRAASDSIATGSSQIAQGNADLSHRTEAQASALQQASATMDELGGTVRRNASSAEAASDLANRATQVAGQGGSVVGQVVETMRGIQSSSQRIAEIIAVIDGIAFQTNILALNAAVEAARAGEHGRGFAVVAGEVRNLAQRSATAAREIKSLISGSVSQVEAGTALVDRAGATMGEIVASIERVSQIVREISTASAAQSDGVGQVGQAVSQMDEATQRNAALVEESAAAADSLKRQADQLVHAVSVFRLGNA